MDEGELKEGLKQTGLSEYEIAAYVTLLNLGNAAATDLAEKADIPRSRIYDVLRDLEDEGFVETYKQDSMRARASDPSGVFERLTDQAHTLEQTAKEIRDRWEQSGVEGHRVSYVKRVDTVVERARSAIERAENQIQLSVSPDMFERLLPDLRDAYGRGVFVSVSFNTSPNIPASLPDDEELADAVTEVRHRDLPAPFLALVDRGVTCFAPHTDPINQYGVIFEDEDLTYVFRWYFKAALWEAWPTVFSTRSDSLPAEYVDIRECIRDIAPLLADGATITATVEGSRTDRREDVELSGVISDVVYATMENDDDRIPALSSLAGRAEIFLETDDGVIQVGGWGAIIESIEAKRISIESVEYEGGSA